jgi:hypothetical protein
MLLLCELRKRGFAAKVIRGVGFIFPFFLRVSSSWLCSFFLVMACVASLALFWASVMLVFAFKLNRHESLFRFARLSFRKGF